MAAAGSGKKGKGSKKLGRKIDECKRYRLSGTREKNKSRKVLRHLMKYPNDKVALEALKNIKPRNRGKT